MTLDEIFEHGKEFAQHAFKEQGEIYPMWICETELGDFIPIVMPIPEHKERDEFVANLKKVLKENKVCRYVSMLESWLHTVEDPPTTKEIVLITAEDISGTEKAGMFLIERKDKKAPTLAKFDEDGTFLGGRFSRLLATQH